MWIIKLIKSWFGSNDKVSPEPIIEQTVTEQPKVEKVEPVAEPVVAAKKTVAAKTRKPRKPKNI